MEAAPAPAPEQPSLQEAQRQSLLAGRQEFEQYWRIFKNDPDIWNSLNDTVSRMAGRQDKRELVLFLRAFLAKGKNDEGLRALDLSSVGLEDIPSETASEPKAPPEAPSEAAPQPTAEPEATLPEAESEIAPQPKPAAERKAAAKPKVASEPKAKGAPKPKGKRPAATEVEDKPQASDSGSETDSAAELERALDERDHIEDRVKLKGRRRPTSTASSSAALGPGSAPLFLVLSSLPLFLPGRGGYWLGGYGTLFGITRPRGYWLCGCLTLFGITSPPSLCLL